MIVTHLLVDGARLCKSDYPRARETEDATLVTCPRCRFLEWERQRPVEDATAFVEAVTDACFGVAREYGLDLLPRHTWCAMLVKRLGGEAPR